MCWICPRSAGKPALNLSQINVVDVTSGVAKMHHLLAEEKGIELDCGCEFSNKQRTLDVDKWLQILTNLLGNAIKYTESGTVSLVSIHDHRQGRLDCRRSDRRGAGHSKRTRRADFSAVWLVDTDSILLEQPTPRAARGWGFPSPGNLPN